MALEDKAPITPTTTSSPPTPIKVAIIEDRRETREALATLIAGTEVFTYVLTW